jgi:hypothetical protein
LAQKEADMICHIRYLGPPTAKSYELCAQERGFATEIVPLSHGAQGFWIGSKDARNVVIYYHGEYIYTYLYLFVLFQPLQIDGRLIMTTRLRRRIPTRWR